MSIKRNVFGMGFCLLALVLLSGCSSKVALDVKNQDVDVEYGKTVSLDAKDYLNNDEKILSKVSVSSNIENEKDKDYPAVGDYEITLAYDDKTEAKVNVSVKDTTAPEFENIEERYEVEHGSKFDTSSIKAKDLSEVTISVDDSSVDYNSAGEYKVNVIAKDSHENETKKEVTLIVKEEVKEETATVPESSNNASAPSSSGSQTVSSQPAYSSSPNYSATPSTPSQPSSGSSSSSGGSSSSSNTDSSSSNTSTPSPSFQYDVGNSGMLFDTEEEAIAWGDKYMMDHIETISGYTGWSTGDKWTIGFKYY